MSYYANIGSPSASGSLVQCLWVVGPYGLRCNHIFDGHQLPAHLREIHGIRGANNLRVHCLWNHCTMELNRENLSRHVEERHLQIIYPCDTCNKPFTRRYNLNKHKTNCPAQQQ